MSFKIQRSIEDQRKELLEEIRKTQDNIDELELTKQEKWYAIKDFHNSYERANSFSNWMKDFYKPGITKLKRELNKLTKRYDLL